MLINDNIVIYINLKKKIKAQYSIHVMLWNEFWEDCCWAAFLILFLYFEFFFVKCDGNFFEACFIFCIFVKWGFYKSRFHYTC